jgi:hypothetical protein
MNQAELNQLAQAASTQQQVLVVIERVERERRVGLREASEMVALARGELSTSVAEAYDPSERRDRKGRWTKGGLGGAEDVTPAWKKTKRYNAWVRSLSPAEQEALARAFYEQLWGELQGYFGDIGMPPPQLVFLPDIETGRVFKDANGIRQVQLPASSILYMALKNPNRRLDQIGLIAHEWRHVFQNAGLYWVGRSQPHDAQPLEEDANSFAILIMQRMQQNRERKLRGKPPLPPYVYEPSRISENIGKDPTKFDYP